MDARTVSVADSIDEPPDAPTDVEALVRLALTQRPENRERAGQGQRVRRSYLGTEEAVCSVAGPERWLRPLLQCWAPRGHPDGGALVLGLSVPIPLDHGRGPSMEPCSRGGESEPRRDGAANAASGRAGGRGGERSVGGMAPLRDMNKELPDFAGISGALLQGRRARLQSSNCSMPTPRRSTEPSAPSSFKPRPRAPRSTSSGRSGLNADFNADLARRASGAPRWEAYAASAWPSSG